MILSDGQIHVEIADDGPVTKRLRVDIASERVAQEMEQAYRAISKEARLKGFRPGKVPREIVKGRYRDVIAQDVSERLVDLSFQTIVREASLSVVSPPHVIERGPVAEGEPFRYEATVEVRPAITLGTYTGLEVTEENAAVSAEAVEAELDRLRTAHARARSIPEARGIEEGDLAIVDLEGVSVADGRRLVRREGFPIDVGSPALPREVARGLLGMRPGETREMTVTFPEDHTDAEWRGRAVRWRVSLTEMKSIERPALTDDFAREVGPATLADLREEIRRALARAAAEEADAKLKDQIVDTLLAAHPFDVPASLVEREVAAMVEGAVQRLRRQGLGPARPLDTPALREAFRPGATRRVRAALLLEAIADAEGIRVDDAEVEAELARIAEQAGQPTDVVRRFYRDHDLLEDLHGERRAAKTLAWLRERARVRPAPGPEGAEAAP